MKRIDYEINALPFPYSRDANYEEWVAARWDYVSSSTIPSLLGLNSYSSPLKYWKEYVERKSSFIENDYTNAGTVMERPIQVLAEKQNKGYIIDELNLTYISKDFPFITATPDGLVKVPHRAEIGLNETKFTSRDMDLWEKGVVPGWCYAQVQLQLGVCKMPWCLVTAMVQGKAKVFCLEVEYNHQVYLSLVKAAEQFLSLVRDKQRPPATGLDVDTEIVNQIVQKRPEAELLAPTAEVDSLIKELIAVETLMKDTGYNALEKKKKEITNNLKLLTEGYKSVKATDGSSLSITKVEVAERVNPGYSFYKLTARGAKE